MKSKRLLLTETLLKSTSAINAYKYCNDKKKRSRTTSRLVGRGIIYLLILFYGSLVSIMMGKTGMEEALPKICGVAICFANFLLTLLKTNGYLFAFKEYDMLMAMPFKIKDVIAAKFIYMYINSLPITMCLSISMLVGYLLSDSASVLSAIVWIILTLFLPMIVMVIASLIGAMIVRIGSGFKYKKVFSILITFIIIIPLFFIGTFINVFMQKHNYDFNLAASSVANGIDGIYRYFPGAVWFTKAICDNSIADMLILIGMSLIVLEVFVILIAKSYTKINSRLMTNGIHKTFKLGADRQKQRSKIVAVAFKEYKRMTGSTIYFTNAAIGEVMVLLLAVATIVFKVETLIDTVLKGAPVKKEVLIPAIPLIIYFLVGMVATTCCTPSLEGKNAWIIKSIPISPLEDCKGKMLFNICLQLPIALIGTICLEHAVGASAIELILGCILMTSLCLFSTTYGMVCGLKYIKLDWENEVEVIKQGTAMTLYILPNMFATMIIATGCIFLGFVINVTVVYLSLIAIVLLLALLMYRKVNKLAI